MISKFYILLDFIEVYAYVLTKHLKLHVGIGTIV